MTFEELQKVWQMQPGGFRINIDSGLLFNEVRKNKEHFEATVFWRDVREGGGSLIMAGFIFYIGIQENLWTIIPLAFLTLFVGVFIIVDRMKQRKKQPDSCETLFQCIEVSLAQVNHQIRLLKNVFWWYLLPFAIGIAFFWGSCAFDLIRFIGHTEAKKGLFFFVGCFAGGGLLYWGIYHLNQWAVRKELLPRKEELEKLLVSLKEAGE